MEMFSRLQAEADARRQLEREEAKKDREEAEARRLQEKEEAERRMQQERELAELRRQDEALKWQQLIKQQEERMHQLSLELEIKREDPSMGKSIHKHQKLADNDDIDIFLSTFEAHMITFKVNKKYCRGR